MEEVKTTLSLYAGEKSAGGKFRKPPPQSNQSAAQAQLRDGCWFSKLVDPAYRLIATGAYMGSRTSELTRSSYGIISKNERANNCSNEDQTCWPGTMLKYQHTHLTPYTERGRCGLHNFPHTPYSRTLFSKSKGKVTQLQADSR